MSRVVTRADRRRWRLAIAAAFWLLVPCVSAWGQPGIDAPAPVGPYLDGAFPSTAPSLDFDWGVADAFPGLPVSNVSAIEPNPVDGRIYVGSRNGAIRSFVNAPAVSTTEPFMDLSDRVAVVNDGGFLGLVFHPEFGQPGSPHELTFYAYYTGHCPINATADGIDLTSCNPGYPTGDFNGFFNTWMRLSRFTASFDATAGRYVGDPASETPMINVRQMGGSHYGGGMVFDASGLLYVSMGDMVRYETAQDIVDTLEGGIMRLAVDVIDGGDGTWTCPAGSHQPIRAFPDTSGNADEVSGRLYCIPDGNPWADPTGSQFEEYFSIGHRNPHRLAYDLPTGRIWSGEVGERDREEVNVIGAGNNYGWPFREGLIAGPRPEPPSYLGVLTDPVIDFTRSEARALIGGFVYRGTRLPELQGRFLAGDFVTRNVFAIDLDPSTMTATAEVLTTFTPGGLGTFGRGLDGEVYLGSVTQTLPLQQLERVVSSGPSGVPTRLSDVGAFDQLSTLDVHDAAVPYDLVPFWSDGAAKSRWIFLPNDGTHDQPDEQIAFSESGDWIFPEGTVLMKHFELPLSEDDPQITTRLETRFLVNAAGGAGWYGVSYRWEADQLDALLVGFQETGDYTIQTSGGGTRDQTWIFPGPTECLVCHTPEAGGALGPRTHQLNRDLTYPGSGITDNQLRTWNHLGMLKPSLDELAIPGYLAGHQLFDPAASLKDRARAWLDTNCSYCHRPGTPIAATFDARLTTPLASQGLVWGPVNDTLGIPDAFAIKPGEPLSSIVLHRAAALGPIAMPPLAKNLVHDDGMAVLADWIAVLRDLPRPGLVYAYYEETGLTSLPDFDLLTPVSTGHVGTFDLSVRERDDDFAILFSGVVDVPTEGTWTFYTTSDEGSQLFVDGGLVVDNDGLHPATEASGAVFLTAGFHEIVVTVFEATGTQSLSVGWEGPGVAQQIVPSGLLFEEAPSGVPNQPPVLVQPSDQSDGVGDPVSLALEADDLDGDPLVYSAQDLPDGLSIDPVSGVIDGTLGVASGGIHSVLVGVSDGPSVDSRAFTWTVTGGDSVPPGVSITSPMPGEVILTGMATITASASDDVGVAGVQFLLNGLPLGNEDLVAPFELPWDTGVEADGAYTLSARARDTAGNTALAPDVVVTVDNTSAPPPVAAWSFDEGTGSVAFDGTGGGHDGTVTGATWLPSGMHGGALAFDGVDDVVTVPHDSELDLTTGEMTISAWVYPETTYSGWTAILQKQPNLYFLNAATSTGRPGGGGTFAGSCCTSLSAPSALPVGVWSHVALTYDGSLLRYYVDGVLVRTKSASGPIATSGLPLRIGANEYPGEALEGRLDEVRLYARALSLEQIQTDMSTGTTPNTAPTVTILAPPDGTEVGEGTPVDLEATASDAEDGPLDAAIVWTSSLDGALGAGPLVTAGSLTVGTHTITAEVTDSGSAVGSDEISVGVVSVAPPVVTSFAATPDTLPEGDSTTLAWTTTGATSVDVDGGVGTGLAPNASIVVSPTVTTTYTLTATGPFGMATDMVTVTVTPPPPTVDTFSATPEIVELGGSTLLGWSTSNATQVDIDGGVGTGLAPIGAVEVFPTSTTLYTLTATGPFGVDTAQVAVTVVEPALPVASWGFDEGGGATAFDGTGGGHDGTVSGAQWVGGGVFGGALQFDGVDDVVEVAHQATLDLAAGEMTISAWVNPDAPLSGWTAILQKQPNLYFLNAATANDRPGGGGTFAGSCCTWLAAPSGQTLPAGVWTHVAVSYDGSLLRYYVDGVEVGSKAASGPIGTSTSPLRIGANEYPAEALAGRLDEVRLYDRALTQQQVQADMLVGVTTPPNADPMVTIDAPADGTEMAEGTPIDLEGTAMDAEDGVLDGDIVWTSDLDGVLGAGSLVTRDDLTVGTHAITAAVTDSGGATGDDTITVTVLPEPGVLASLGAGGVLLGLLGRRRARRCSCS